MRLVLLVLFVMVMFLWLLVMLGAAGLAIHSAWLAFFACLFLGLAVFVGDAWGGKP